MSAGLEATAQELYGPMLEHVKQVNGEHAQQLQQYANGEAANNGQEQA